jgi:nucleotide-binding universal stress UspA family protein
MKKILFPTDFSEASKHAFIYALRAASRIGASITTLHVYKLPDLKAPHLPRSLAEVYDSIAIEEFENYRDRIPVLHEISRDEGISNLRLMNVMEEGDVIPTILRVARRDNIDLIIMGTKGAGWLKEILLGTVAAEILENANCPVIAVPQHTTFDGKIDRIAVLTEFLDEEKILLTKVSEFASFFNATLDCIHVDLALTHDYTHRMDQFRKDCEEIGNIDFKVLQGLDLFKAVGEYVEEENIDILAILTHKRNFIHEFFHYSVAKKMSYHLNTPILSFQSHALKAKIPK